MNVFIIWRGFMSKMYKLVLILMMSFGVACAISEADSHVNAVKAIVIEVYSFLNNNNQDLNQDLKKLDQAFSIFSQILEDCEDSDKLAWCSKVLDSLYIGFVLLVRATFDGYDSQGDGPGLLVNYFDAEWPQITEKISIKNNDIKIAVLKKEMLRIESLLCEVV
jgi:hypothetical protein